jgi:NADH-quinone oxidoreductase subunit M
LELIILPLAGALISWLGKSLNRQVSFLFSIATLALNLYWLSVFIPDGTLQFEQNVPWMNEGIRVHTGIDGMGMLLLLLANLLTPIILLSRWSMNQEQNRLMLPLILLMQSALNGVFTSMNGLLFYVFWELALIPIYFISAKWGSDNRIRITLKFFLYTFFGSVFMLASLLFLYWKTPGTHSFEWASLVAVELTEAEAWWVGAGLLIAFLIKIPVFPFHTWQADTYTAAPAAGSMLLSGIMLKMGFFGLFRWYLPLVPEVIQSQMSWVGLLAVVGVIYGGFIALRQNDLKRLVAYSSFSHVGLIAAGIATLTINGFQGAAIQMFNHGINIVALFFAISIIEQRMGSRSMTQLRGLAASSRVFAILFMVAVLGTVAVPLTNGFPGELLLLQAVFASNAVYGILAGLTIILCAAYMLRMYQFSMFGDAAEHQPAFQALVPSEWLGMGILASLILVFGIFPQPILDLTHASMTQLLEIIQERIALR